jgi:hypothetical protein
MIFYRYVRPVRLNLERCEIETDPKGGVCLRFERNGDETLKFSFSRCHENELFSKEVAKRVADERALRAVDEPKIENIADKHLLIEQVIDYCLSWKGDGSVAHEYLGHEYRDLAYALLRIMKRAVKTEERLQRELDRIEFLSISKEYADA